MATKKTSIGGQALIEGIMMRGPKVTAMAVRNVNTKQITLEEYPTKGQDRAKILKLPFIRHIQHDRLAVLRLQVPDALGGAVGH